MQADSVIEIEMIRVQKYYLFRSVGENVGAVFGHQGLGHAYTQKYIITCKHTHT
jgi:hypothetical protein